MSAQAALAADELTKSFGRATACDRITLRVHDAERFVVLGPSGSGKTTLLRMLAGLERPDRGRVFIGGRDVTALAPRERAAAMVFPHGALFPHMSLRSNLAFSRAGRAEVDAMLDQFDLSHLAERRPATLSGGERQRAALARALLAQPRALLLDEPLASLDPPARETMRALMLRIARERGCAVVIVTHDHDEALGTADRLAMIFDGRIVQSGTPEAVYARPVSVRVAKFLGPNPMNVVSSNGSLLGIRPADVVVGADGELEGVVTACDFSGSGWLARVQTRAGEILVQQPERMSEGQTVRLAFPPQRAQHFDAATGAALE